MKITFLITTSLTCLICREMIIRNQNSKGKDMKRYRFLVTIGNYSFGFYLSHIAIMMLFNKIPSYIYIPYLCNSCLVLFTSLIFSIIGNMLLGKIRFGKIHLSQIVGMR